MSAPELLHPRGMVLVNKIPINFSLFEVDRNNYYQADKFRVQAPIEGQPDGIDLEFWASQTAILIEIKAGYPANPQSYNANDLESLIIGAVEPLSINIGPMGLEISGRDLTSKLIDTKTFDKYQNLTLSQIATKFAELSGLTPVITPTTTRVGSYYQADLVNTVDNATTQWDLLTNLAAKEQMLVYVQGFSLILKPQPTPSSDNIYLMDATRVKGITYANATSLQMTRNLKYAGDIIVEVRTHSLRSGKPETIRVKSTKNKRTVLKGAAQPVGEAQVFSYVEDNLTPEQALQFAYGKLNSLSQFEKVINFTDSANLKLKKDSLIKLTNCSPSIDQNYYLNHLQLTMATNPPRFRMTGSIKNHSPDSVKLI